MGKGEGVLPHPNLLPLGEGTAVVGADKTQSFLSRFRLGLRRELGSLSQRERAGVSERSTLDAGRYLISGTALTSPQIGGCLVISFLSRLWRRGKAEKRDAVTPRLFHAHDLLSAAITG